eukprot:6214630-Pleurochrysis_carterae.AAC.1
MDEVLVQCSSIRTPAARVVLRNFRPSKICLDEECEYGRRRTPAPCQDEASGVTPHAIPAALPQRGKRKTRRCRWRTSQASSQGVHGWQAIQICPSQPPAIPAKKSEMMGPRHPACKREQVVQPTVHALCQSLSGFARAPQATAQPSREVALLMREPGSGSV